MASVLPICFVIAAGLCLSLVLLALWQSLRMLLIGRPAAPLAAAPRDPKREALLREKQELLTAIRDVRFEHELGKVSDADFERLEQRYRARARDVLRELDEQIAPYREEARSLISRAIGGDTTAEAKTKSAPAPIAASAVACAQCGAGNDSDALFCKKCGARLRSEATA
jgi:ribosomal protein L40E